MGDAAGGSELGVLGRARPWRRARAPVPAPAPGVWRCPGCRLSSPPTRGSHLQAVLEWTLGVGRGTDREACGLARPRWP